MSEYRGRFDIYIYIELGKEKYKDEIVLRIADYKIIVDTLVGNSVLCYVSEQEKLLISHL
jgi:hypothetical protein